MRVTSLRSLICSSVLSCPDDSLSKCQRIFTKLSVCIDIVEIWFGVVNSQFRQFLTELSACNMLYSHFQMITLININGFSPNLVCALILWRPGLGLLKGKFHQFLTELSASNMSVFSFMNDNFSNYQWIFTKLGMHIDIVELCFGIADGQISSIFDSYLPVTHQYFHFWMITLVNINEFSPNLVCAWILWSSALVLLMGKFYLFLTELSAHNTSVFYFQDNNLMGTHQI